MPIDPHESDAAAAARAGRCRGCGGALSVLHERVLDRMSGAYFSVLRCDGCGLARTWPDAADRERHYGDVYWGDRHGFTRGMCLRRRSALLEGIGPRRGRLLDVGCGDGGFLEEASRLGFRAVGTEIGAALEAAVARGLDVRASLEAAADLGPFDVATMWHSLHHLPDPRATLEEIAALLAPDGILIVAVPDIESLDGRAFGARSSCFDVPRDLHHFDRRSLPALLEAAGFSPRTIRHVEIEYDLFGWIQSCLNVLSPSPMALYDFLIGRRGHAIGATAKSLAIGAAALPIAACATAVGAAIGVTSTVVAVARKRHVALRGS